MAKIASKKSVNNNLGLLKTVDGVNEKDVVNITDFGRFFVVLLKDEAIFHTHLGFEVRIKRWGGVDLNGEALPTTTYTWLENLVDMAKETKTKANELFPETDETYQDMLDAMIIITEANITFPMTAFADADEAGKFASERIKYLTSMQDKLETIMSTPVAEETEDDLKKNFEHGQQATIAEELQKE